MTPSDDARRAILARLVADRDNLISRILDSDLTDQMRSNTAEHATRLTHYITALCWTLGELPDTALGLKE